MILNIISVVIDYEEHRRSKSKGREVLPGSRQRSAGFFGLLRRGQSLPLPTSVVLLELLR